MDAITYALAAKRLCGSKLAGIRSRRTDPSVRRVGLISVLSNVWISEEVYVQKFAL